MSTNRAGIVPGNQVLVYLENHYDRRQTEAGLHWAPVERVTPTQVIVEGIKYYSDPYDGRRGKPVNLEDAQYQGDGASGGRRRFAHPNIVHDWKWDHLLAVKNRPESYLRARALNDTAYEVLGYPYLLTGPQIIKLSADPAAMVALEKRIQDCQKVREQELANARSFYALMTGLEIPDAS